MKCHLPGCDSQYNNQPGQSYHRAPKDPYMRVKWFEICELPYDSVKNLRVCSKHFRKEDYESSLGCYKRRVLKKTAIPLTCDSTALQDPQENGQETSESGLFMLLDAIEQVEGRGNPSGNLGDTSDAQCASNKQDSEKPHTYVNENISDPVDREQITNQPETYDGVLFNEPEETEPFVIRESVLQNVDQSSETLKEIVPSSVGFYHDHSYAMNLEQYSAELTSDLYPAFPTVEDDLEIERMTSNMLRKQLTALRTKYDQEQKVHSRYVNYMEKEKKDQQKRIFDLREACDALQNVKEHEILTRVRMEMGKILTPNQVELILGLKKKAHWTAEEIALSFTIRYHGISTWNLLKKELNYPLPSLNTLRVWGSKIKMHIGLLQDVLQLMKIAAPTMPANDKVVILSFDEMSVESTFEYDSRNDITLGPHKNLQVVMARGLFKQWKQPVYARFDTKMTPDILNEIVIKLYEVGYDVVGCVSDCGGGNQGLWSTLGVSHEHSSILHPITKNNIYFFADAPHLLKLFRNWLLDHGFFFKGKQVTKTFLKLLVSKGTTIKQQGKTIPEFNSLFRLTKRHLLCKQSERQNVKLAAELISHTTAVNLRRHFGNYEEANTLADIVEVADAWFNVLNSHSMRERVESKKCYGMALQKQNEILDQMTSTISSIRTLNKHRLPAARSLQVFQKGILMTTLSTKLLLEDMRNRYGVKFIMTYKLNQDLLENLFAQVRQNGGPNNHPTPKDALNRLRLIILGKGLRNQLRHNQNAQDILIQENFIISDVFKHARIFEEEQEDDFEDFSGWTHTPVSRTLEEEDGFSYAMGYVARSLNVAHPDLGSYTYQQMEVDGENSSEQYVLDLSHGGLTNPSDKFLEDAERMDSFFTALHNGKDNNGFKNNKNIRKRTTELMKKQFPEIPEDVINKFIRTRINIRVRHTKKGIIEKKFMKYKAGFKVAINSAVVKKNEQKLKHFRN